MVETLTPDSGNTPELNRDTTGILLQGHWSGLLSQTCLMQRLVGWDVCMPDKTTTMAPNSLWLPRQPHGIQCEQRMIPTLDTEKKKKKEVI